MIGLLYYLVCSYDIGIILKKYEKVIEKFKFIMFFVLIFLCIIFILIWMIFDN